MQAKVEAVEAKVKECIALAEKKFCVEMPNVAVRFDLTGKAAGVAMRRWNTYTLRFNPRHMALGGKTWDHILNDVVPHEVAHTVCQSNPRVGHGHNRGWKNVCLALGGNGQRCYTDEDTPELAAQTELPPYVYITTTGVEIRITKVRHNKIQRGSQYTVRGKGELNRECAFNYMVATPATAPKVTARKAPRKATGTKADLIRAQIALGKTKDECIAYGVMVLNMRRALAKTYVNNNW